MGEPSKTMDIQSVKRKTGEIENYGICGTDLDLITPNDHVSE